LVTFLATGAALLLAGRAAVRRAGLFPVRVAGESMMPTLRAGDFLAASQVRDKDLRRGALVLANEVSGVEAVKRVGKMPGENGLGPASYWLLGDNRDASTDSRTHGPYDREQIVGVVRARYWPPLRVRLFTS
jgi:signal peptidase S26 family